MKVRDATLSQHGSDRDRLKLTTSNAILKMAQTGHEHGLTPREVLECLTMATAHVADVAGIRKEAAQFMRAWADDLEKTELPVAIRAEGTA